MSPCSLNRSLLTFRRAMLPSSSQFAIFSEVLLSTLLPDVDNDLPDYAASFARRHSVLFIIITVRISDSNTINIICISSCGMVGINFGKTALFWECFQIYLEQR
jgi:hypothetical protein